MNSFRPVRVVLFLAVAFSATPCSASLWELCKKVLGAAGETPAAPTAPAALSFDEAVDLLHAAVNEKDPARQVVLLSNALKESRVANAILAATSPAKTLPEVIEALKPEVTTLDEAKAADFVVSGLANVMPLYYALRYNEAVPSDVRKTFAEGQYRILAFLLHSRHAQLVAVRVASRLAKDDPGLSDLAKFRAALDAETKPPIFRGSPPCVVRAYAPALARAKKGELKAAVEYVKSWYRSEVFDFEGTRPEEVDRWMRLNAEVLELRYAIERLSEQTDETKEAAAFLKEMNRPKSEDEARKIIANLKKDRAAADLFRDDIARWEKQLKSDDELLRADVGRRVTHAVWRLEYLAEHGRSLEQRMAAAQVLTTATGQSVTVRIQD